MFADVATYNQLLATQLASPVFSHIYAVSGEDLHCNATSGKSVDNNHALFGTVHCEADAAFKADEATNFDTPASMLCFLFPSLFGDLGDSFNRIAPHRLSIEHSIDLPHSSLYACTGVLCDHISTTIAVRRDSKKRRFEMTTMGKLVGLAGCARPYYHVC